MRNLQGEVAMKGEPIKLYIDTRYNPSRFNFHATAPLLDSKTGEVVDIVIKTRKESLECAKF